MTKQQNKAKPARQDAEPFSFLNLSSPTSSRQVGRWPGAPGELHGWQGLVEGKQQGYVGWEVAGLDCEAVIIPGGQFGLFSS